MRSIQLLVEEINEEIESAKTYAEKALELRAEGNTEASEKFHEMAKDEIRHTTYLHDYTVGLIDRLKSFYKPTAEMQEKWDKSHKEYVEKVAWIKMMLQM